ncbi:DUF2163 domain-containing protein [Klebsiella michiganensis]|uniref:DUF2163 domain-containing protein n=1 Tax=Klebsiella michiganensis TaxID=1134687 RepID=UPI001643C49B|nr:DUF2163 domain-containing protein [Klebsiella michiganensis]MBC3631466.1 DUF2163 domain-containing protein [Klebsiella michiganensis]
MDELLTNPNLIKYFNLVKGENKTKLTITDVMMLGQHVTCFDVFPVNQSAIHWTDAFKEIAMGGVIYQSAPDIIQDSLPSFSEEKGISNNSISFKIRNIDNSMQMMALSGQLFKAKVNIYLVVLDPYTTNPIYSQLQFTGFIDYCEAKADPIQAITELTVNINSIYQKLDVQSRTLASNSVYQSYYPGDEFMSLLGQVNKADQEWRMKK